MVIQILNWASLDLFTDNIKPPLSSASHGRQQIFECFQVLTAEQKPTYVALRSAVGDAFLPGLGFSIPVQSSPVVISGSDAS